MIGDQDQNDPLDVLFVNERSMLDRQLLAEAVRPYATIFMDENGFEINFTESGEGLTAREKLLVFLLARKAVNLRNSMLLAKEAATPKEIEETSHIPGGTIRPVLKRLLDEKLVQQDSEGAYFVGNRSLRQIHGLLAKKG